MYFKIVSSSCKKNWNLLESRIETYLDFVTFILGAPNPKNSAKLEVPDAVTYWNNLTSLLVQCWMFLDIKVLRPYVTIL